MTLPANGLPEGPTLSDRRFFCVVLDEVFTAKLDLVIRY